MTYKNDAYYALERNVTKTEAMKRHIDNARTFNALKYVDNITIIGKGRFDDHETKITVSGELMKEILDLGADHFVSAAKAIHQGEWEANNFEKAAEV